MPYLVPLLMMLALVVGACHAGEGALPEVLVAQDGTPIDSVEAWKTKRRPEILELFRTHVYGRAPVGRPEGLAFKTVETVKDAMDGAATLKRVEVKITGPGGEAVLHLNLFVPQKAAKPVPCFLLACNRGPENIDPTRQVKKPFWPAEEIIARGYATAAFLVADLDPDKDDGFKNGVHGIFDPKGGRTGDAWGTIAAWAWGASRAMDYLCEDPDIDRTRVAVIGHSRGGKTALWAGAQDERFALTISNDSGCTGAAIARGKKGETVARINKSFPHWFCANYKTFGEKEEDLPVDQHELIALMAPRLVYVASASEDAWADPRSEFRSCVHASPVYGLFGLKGLESTDMPKPETPMQAGNIGYHLRTGKHDLTEYDWTCYMDFADRHWKGDASTAPLAPELLDRILQTKTHKLTFPGYPGHGGDPDTAVFELDGLVLGTGQPGWTALRYAISKMGEGHAVLIGSYYGGRGFPFTEEELIAFAKKHGVEIGIPAK